jgi:hypothetical protein
MNHLRLLLVIPLVLPIFLFSQETGCTDPNALNYDPDALTNDGFCLYDTTFGYPRTFIRKIPYQLRECSGIIYYNGGIWTHNDSGGGAEIYKLDITTGEILQTVHIANARNVDWEDIAQDSLFIYIGDFGNNNGTRNDLCVYQLPKSLIIPKRYSEVNATKISFRYADQEDFTSRPRNHNYDCEALLSNGDSLYLFTKNWQDLNTRLYSLPAQPGDYLLIPQDTYRVNGLITGADRDPETGVITLVGYQDFVSFVSLLFDYPERCFFSGNKRRIDLPDFVFVQTEGVASYSDGNVLISCEESALPQGIFILNVALWTDPPGQARMPNTGGSIVIVALQQAKPGRFVFNIENLPEELMKIEIFDVDWNKLDNEDAGVFYDMRDSSLRLDMSGFPSGTYFLRLSSGEEQHVEKITVE